MAVNVRINGADYPDVPAIDVPKTNNGGTATFYDTSGDTATAADVASGKTCHTAGGLITGTASGGDYSFMFKDDDSNVVEASGSGSFYGLSGICELTINGATAIESGALYRAGASRLTKINCPEVTIIWTNGLYLQSRLNEAVFPKLERVIASAFYGCSSLPLIRLPKVTFIGNNSFSGCRVLNDIYIGSADEVPTLQGVSAFNNTPIAMSGSYSSADARIHVRADMVSAFQADTNWSTFASKIVGDYSD